MRREKIQLTDTPMDIITKMSEGNPGVVRVLCELFKQEHGFMLLLDLDDMGIRGPMIWVAFKDHCKQDVAALAKSCRERDKSMIATVNRNGGQAVPHGASS